MHDLFLEHGKESSQIVLKAAIDDPHCAGSGELKIAANWVLIPCLRDSFKVCNQDGKKYYLYALGGWVCCQDRSVMDGDWEGGHGMGQHNVLPSSKDEEGRSN